MKKRYSGMIISVASALMFFCLSLADASPRILTPDTWTIVFLTAPECLAQTEGWYIVEPPELKASDCWGYPYALVSYGYTAHQDFLYDSSLIWNGRSVKAFFWIQIDWNGDGNWDDIYTRQNVTFIWGQLGQEYTIQVAA